MKALLIILCTLFVLFPTVEQVIASPYAQNEKGKSKGISSQRAAQLAKSRVGGKVLKVQSTKIKGKPAYRVKMLKKDGHIVSVVVDAKSGRVKGK